MGISDRIMQRRIFSRIDKDVVRAARPPRRHRQKLRMLTGDGQILEPEVFHDPRRRPHVTCFARLYQHDQKLWHQFSVSSSGVIGLYASTRAAHAARYRSRGTLKKRGKSAIRGESPSRTYTNPPCSKSIIRQSSSASS